MTEEFINVVFFCADSTLFCTQLDNNDVLSQLNSLSILVASGPSNNCLLKYEKTK